MSLRLLLLGPPGSGKGTQAKILASKLDIVHISPGDMFRREVRKGTQMGREVSEAMSRGELVRDDITIKMMGEELASRDASKGFILDGFPRNMTQAEALEVMLRRLGMKLDLVINLVVSEESLLARGRQRRICQVCGKPYNLAGAPPRKPGVCDVCGGALVQRDDDREEAMMERFRVYREATEPVVGYYQKKGILHSVDGEMPIEQVTESILGVIGHFVTRKSGVK